MRTPAIIQRPRRVQSVTFPAPTAGWVSNRNLSMAEEGGPAAEVLENWFPTSTGIRLRRGYVQWTAIPAAVVSLFSYSAGGAKQLFAASPAGIYNITTQGAAPSVRTGLTSGDWVTAQYTTAGGTFLIGVNGQDPAWSYDGTTFALSAITFPVGSGKTTANLSYTWVYRNRIWFIEKNSLNAWYLPGDQIAGELTLWPMGGVFQLGGALLWGQTWSIEGGGGLTGQCVFMTTEGEVAAYQGLSPDPGQGWTHVGTYRTGRPLGAKALVRAGGDLLIATTVGLISLAQAARSDYAALGKSAVSYSIEDEWARYVSERGESNWRCQVWSEGQMMLVAPPTISETDPNVLVTNTNTAAWCLFSGWDISALSAFNGRLFFGSPDGTINLASVSGTDNGKPYVGRSLPLFTDGGAPGSVKIVRHARALTRSEYGAKIKVTAQFNFNTKFPAAPDALVPSDASLWDVAEWDISTWATTSQPLVVGKWISIGGSGHDVSVATQVTSSSIAPLDVELVRMDVTYEIAGIVT